MGCLLVMGSRLGQGARCRAILQRLLCITRELMATGDKRSWEQAKLLAREVAQLSLLQRHYMSRDEQVI